MPAQEPSDRVLIAKIAAAERWSREENRAAAMAAARRGFLDRFDRQVDPDGVLSPQERAKRAEHALKAHMARMALKSAQARRAKAKGKKSPK